MITRLLTCITFAFISVTVFAQELEKREYTHNELMNLSMDKLLDLDVNVQVVSSQGEKLFNSSSTVTIINKQTILDYNYQSITEALQTVAGFANYSTYLKKDIPTARGVLQNHYANKVLILINGIPTFNAITGEGIVDRIDIHDVERIEVLKGPASVMYGSNAYSGAVNIILKTDKYPGVESHAGFGFSNIFTAGAHTKAAKNNFKIFVAANSRSKKRVVTEFTDENQETGVITDNINNKNITLLASYKAHSVLINGYQNSEGFLGTQASYESGANIPHKLKGYLLNYQYNKELSSQLTIAANAGLDWNYRSFARTRSDSIRSEVFGNRTSADLKLNFKLNEHFSFDAGANFDHRQSFRYTNYIRQNETVISDNNLKNKNVLEHSYFAQTIIKSGKLLSTIGLRYTQNELFRENLSTRLSFVYSINDNNAIKLIYGESYRSPSLFELYFLNPDSTVFGNQYLLPERSQSFEAAYLTSLNHFFVQIIGYYAKHRNKIQRTTADVTINNTTYPGQIQYNNGNDFQSYGIETELKYNNPKYIQGFINYNFCAGSNGDKSATSDHYNFKYIPSHQVSSGLNKSFKNDMFSSVLLNYWSETNGAIEKIPEQYTLDFNLGYKQIFNRVGIVHTISIQNLLNSKIDIPEYVRGNINSITVKNGMSIFYTIKMDIF